MKFLLKFVIIFLITFQYYCLIIEGLHSPPTTTPPPKKTKCMTEPTTLKKVEKLIKECEDDVKIHLIQEAFEVIHDDSHWHRSKRYVDFDFTHSHPTTLQHEDRFLAGCLMHCIYRKSHATDFFGWPTLDGLVKLYSDGVNDHDYFMATLKAAAYCLKGATIKYEIHRSIPSNRDQQCNLSFDVFDCISDKIIEYCSDFHYIPNHHDHDHH